MNVLYSHQSLEHGIAGNRVIAKNTHRLWKCLQCNPNERRLILRIKDKLSDCYADFFMRKTIVNGQEVMQVKIANVTHYVFSNNPQPFSLPLGEFTMIKQ